MMNYISLNVKYPSNMPTIPMTMPTFSISFCFTRPVEWAMALGGVADTSKRKP